MPDSAWNERPLLDATARLAPNLPNLKHIKGIGLRLSRGDSAYFRRVFQDLGHTVETVDVQGNLGMEFFFQPDTFATFPQLQRLAIRGEAEETISWAHSDWVPGVNQTYTPQLMRAIFPTSLRSLDVTWASGVSFGAVFMSELADPTFLPNLEQCPHLHYDVNLEGMGDDILRIRTRMVKELEHLEYVGLSTTQHERISADCFPVTLRRLDVTWKGSPQISVDILSLLNDSRFLPNLEACPRIVYATADADDDDSDDDDDDDEILAEKIREEMITHYIKGSKAYKNIMRRPKVTTREFFYHENHNHVEGQVYCLPSPISYLQSLHWEARELLEELTASGRISGYTA